MNRTVRRRVRPFRKKRAAASPTNLRTLDDGMSYINRFLLPLLTCLLGCSGKEAPNASNPKPSDATPCSADAASIRATVFAASCNGVGCHGSELPAVGLNLLDVSPDELESKSSALCSGWSLVVPGSPEKSFLYQKLASTMPACGEAMPIGGQLSQAEVQCVGDWIRGMAAGGQCETCGGSACVALSSDSQHCGSCNNACPAGVACENGSCACTTGTQACDGACVDVMTNLAHCGACGVTCSPGSTCEAGQCTCPASLEACSGQCVEVNSDGQHCGNCETSCTGEQVCLLGTCAAGCGDLQQCGTSCVDTQTSLLHCGGCNQACPGGLACQAGSCGCPDAGATKCGDGCVDVQTDANNCGECGQACGAGETCVEGSCQCDAGGSVSFKNDVAPILARGCSAAGCHTGVKPKEGLDLNEAKSFAELVNVASQQCDDRVLVVPGSPSTSYLMQKMLNVDICMGTQMPKAGQSLPAAELAAINGWICAGAPNN
jgi:hypothetical protein